ncbi:PhoX family protein, partial [Candidatus Entotheonella palauensis]|uniref:PhoX family protein n=1 Tax=Candidatus Entotheonella palauensis TaxID=93172 RepID=UPI000B7CDA6E
MQDNFQKRLAQASNKSEAYELSENVPRNPSDAHTLGDVIYQRFSRRLMIKGTLAVSAMAAVTSSASFLRGNAAHAAPQPTFSFDEISHGADIDHHVAPGYQADILIRWGDPVTADAPPFDPHQQTPESQEKQFGYNNDYVGYLPLPLGSGNAGHGLLLINHEYTNEELMFPGLGRQDTFGGGDFSGMTQALVDIEMSAHGASILEVNKVNGKWQVVRGSPYNRRITTRTTEMRLSGPAAGDALMKTVADPTGTRVMGMLNNCAGGITPWGTVLTGEENIRGYFWTEGDPKAVAAPYKRYGIPGKWYAWGKFHDRFNIDKEPNECNRFGYIVEVDPYDPISLPVKRTALGRCAHEGADVVVNADGRVVAYTGDDARFEYLYKFVSNGRFDPNNREANRHLLDDGTLYAARFNDDGTVSWLPLVHGQTPLTAENGFHSQAEVLIHTRQAADALGATPMDRPEDVEVNPKTGKVYVMLT